MSKENGWLDTEELQLLGDEVQTPNCSDCDEDCKDVKDKVFCYLYDPQRGMCPFLRSERSKP